MANKCHFFHLAVAGSEMSLVGDIFFHNFFLKENIN